jgi:hypothetical protein
MLFGTIRKFIRYPPISRAEMRSHSARFQRQFNVNISTSVQRQRKLSTSVQRQFNVNVNFQRQFNVNSTSTSKNNVNSTSTSKNNVISTSIQRLTLTLTLTLTLFFEDLDNFTVAFWARARAVGLYTHHTSRVDRCSHR